MKKQYYLIFFFIFIFGLNACSDNPNQTTNDLTTEIQETTTELPTTEEIVSTNNQTTTTEAPSDTPTDNETTDTPTTQITTNLTTSVPTTEEPTTVPTTTQEPTTVPTTTQEPTTILVIEITLNDGLGGTYDILYGSPGDTIILPSDPTRSSYVFDGWYVDQAYTTPFVSTVFPSSNITVYAKWVEEVNPADLIMNALETDYDFVCTNNICVYEQNPWLKYYFNFNNLTFKKELIDDDNSDSQTKHELVIINENYQVDYSFSIQYLSNSASMDVSGNATTRVYNTDSFSSNPSSYLTESNVYDDAVDFINDAVDFLEFLVSDLEIDYNELN